MNVISSDELEKIKISFIEASKNTRSIFEGFYSSLFEYDPTIKELFKNVDLAKQKNMLFESITYFITNKEITDEDLNEYVEILKQNHHSVHITPSQMESFKVIFLKMIEQTHKDSHSDEIKTIWTKLFDEIFTRFAKNDLNKSINQKVRE